MSFPAAFAGFLLVVVIEATGFVGHITIKMARILVRYVQLGWDIFPLVKSVFLRTGHPRRGPWDVLEIGRAHV